MEATGSVETCISLRGRKRSPSADDISCIDHLIQQQPNIAIYEITDTLQLHASDETVRKAIVKLGYIYKKKSLHALEQDRSLCSAEADRLASVSISERHWPILYFSMKARLIAT